MKILSVLVLFFVYVGVSSELYSQSDVWPAKQTEIRMTPIFHGTLVLQWGGKTIYVDPYGGAKRFKDFAKPDLVLITHSHGDHLDPSTLEGLDLIGATLIAPESVAEKSGNFGFAFINVMKNGQETSWQNINVKAVPMYNLPEDETSRHKKAWGNGYVLTIDGVQIYISGDTEDIPEMRELEGIDYAFVCMNLPYTMDVQQAASAVLDFKPKVVYPYHYRGRPDFSDVRLFQQLVEAGGVEVEVRLRDWYAPEPE